MPASVEHAQRGLAERGAVMQHPTVLSALQEAFVHAFVRTGDAAEAAREVDREKSTALLWLCMPKIKQRIREIREDNLQVAHITPQRVMLELGRLAFGDIRSAYDARGALKSPHEMDDDTAAVIAGIESEEKTIKESVPLIDPETGEQAIDLVTGELQFTEVTRTVQVKKLKRYDKNVALNTLAKHFKIVGDEGDGLNAIANALSDRLRSGRQRIIDMGEAQQVEPPSIGKD